jgi:hypothetical protein
LWGRSLDMRPIWACFWEYLADVFEIKTGTDPDAWADELRNRLGLYDMNPRARTIPEIPIVVLRYPISSLPHLKGDKDSKPIAVPTVLDGRFNEAFCPPPREQSHGFPIYLGKGPDYEPQREILHPAIQFKAEHVFKVGRIKQPPPEELAAARSVHLLWLRLELNRPDYSVTVDGP